MGIIRKTRVKEQSNIWRIALGPIQKNIRLSFLISIIIILVLPLFLNNAWTVIVIEMFILAIVATAANLMTGYGGMVSFGLAGFYGLGAYVTALLILKTNCSFSIAFIAAPIFGALLSVPISWLCVRRTAIYFSMISLAFSQLLYVVVYTWYEFTGGDDGIVGVPIPEFLCSIKNYYYFAFVVMLICLWLMWRVINSPFGKAIQAARENTERCEFIGMNVRKFQMGIFIVSSFFLSTGGALYMGLNKNAFAEYLYWSKTFEIIVTYLLGGIYSFIGPTIGAVVYIFINKIITQYTQYWPLTLGLIIVIITIYVPNGLGGFLEEKYFKHILKKNKI